MKTVVVLSGKGGTGKTAVSASLAALEAATGRRLILADADVDASNLPLVLEPTPGEWHEFVGGERAVVDGDACTGCGLCAEHCRFEAIRMDTSSDGEDRARIDPLACEGCAVCDFVCPDDAITLVPCVDGEWMVGETRFGPLVSARLRAAGENSGKLVTQVRKVAAELAATRDADLVLVDGPPGIGCPVIASMSGVDLVLAVTEPTPLARSDLERLLRVARHFQVRVAVVVNKADLNLELTRDLTSALASEGVPVLGTLPYDESVVLCLGRALSPAECGGPMGEALASVHTRFEQVLNELEGAAQDAPVVGSSPPPSPDSRTSETP